MIFNFSLVLTCQIHWTIILCFFEKKLHLQLWTETRVTLPTSDYKEPRDYNTEEPPEYSATQEQGPSSTASSGVWGMRIGSEPYQFGRFLKVIALNTSKKRTCIWKIWMDQMLLCLCYQLCYILHIFCAGLTHNNRELNGYTSHFHFKLNIIVFLIKDTLICSGCVMFMFRYNNKSNYFWNNDLRQAHSSFTTRYPGHM